MPFSVLLGHFPGGFPYIELLPTTETDPTKLLTPDGVGGIQWGCFDIVNLCTTQTSVSKRIAPDGSGGLQWVEAALWSLDNTIYIDPDDPEVPGRIHQSIASALAYIAGLPGPQQPSSTNRWTIVVGGPNNESFTLPSWVRVEGNGSTTLTGAIDTAGPVGADLFEYYILRCHLQNIALTAGHHLTTTECTITNAGNSTLGSMTMVDCACFGDFSHIIPNAIESLFADCTFTVEALGAPNFTNCMFVDSGGSCSLAPGNYSECYIYHATILTDVGHNFYVNGGYFNCPGAVVPDGCTWDFKGVLIASSITVGAGTSGILYTYGCASSVGVATPVTVLAGGIWRNRGELQAKARLAVTAFIAANTTLNTNASGAGYTHTGDKVSIGNASEYSHFHSIRILVNGVEQDKQTSALRVSEWSFRLPSLALNAGDVLTIYS